MYLKKYKYNIFTFKQKFNFLNEKKSNLKKIQHGIPMIPGPNLTLSRMMWCQIKFRTWCQSSSIYCKTPETKCNKNK